MEEISPSSTELSETERIKLQTNREWVEDYEGIDEKKEPKPSQAISPQTETSDNEHSPFLKSLKKAGIVSVRFIGGNLLINTDKPISAELDNRIKRAILRLAEIAEPDTGESLYVYTGYRTFFNKGPFLAITFNEIHSGAFAERYFAAELKNKMGTCFKTGLNCEFRVVGNVKRLQEGMFLKCWMDTVKQIPNGRLSQIYRYMNSKLSGAVFSCPNSIPHHGFTKLKSLKYEGHIYQIT